MKRLLHLYFILLATISSVSAKTQKPIAPRSTLSMSVSGGGSVFKCLNGNPNATEGASPFFSFMTDGNIIYISSGGFVAQVYSHFLYAEKDDKFLLAKAAGLDQKTTANKVSYFSCMGIFGYAGPLSYASEKNNQSNNVNLGFALHVGLRSMKISDSKSKNPKIEDAHLELTTPFIGAGLLLSAHLTDGFLGEAYMGLSCLDTGVLDLTSIIVAGKESANKPAVAIKELAIRPSGLIKVSIGYKSGAGYIGLRSLFEYIIITGKGDPLTLTSLPSTGTDEYLKSPNPCTLSLGVFVGIDLS